MKRIFLFSSISLFLLLNSVVPYSYAMEQQEKEQEKKQEKTETPQQDEKEDVKLFQNGIFGIIDEDKLTYYCLEFLLSDEFSFSPFDFLTLLQEDQIGSKIAPQADKFLEKIASLIVDTQGGSLEEAKELVLHGGETLAIFIGAIKKRYVDNDLDEQAKKELTQIISKTIAKTAISSKISPKNFKRILAGVTGTITLWLLSHALCHEQIEQIEPQTFLASTALATATTGSIYYFIKNYLQEPKSIIGIVSRILPNIAHWFTSETSIGRAFKTEISELLKSISDYFEEPKTSK